jgi:hypothetical protein
MADEYNPANQKADTEQGNPETAKEGIRESQAGTIQQPDSEKKGGAADKPPKPTILVRVWHALWRKRLLFHRRHDGGPNWAEKTSMYITGGILIATIIQALIYWKQAGIMECSLEQNQQSIALNMGQVAIASRNAKTAENTLGEIKNGAPDTHTLAESTKSAAKTAVEAFHVSERAYVTLSRQNDSGRSRGYSPAIAHIDSHSVLHQVQLRGISHRLRL